MATIEYWIQLENRPWDASPNNIDRMTGQDIEEETALPPIPGIVLASPTGATRTVTMYNPLRDPSDNTKVIDALIFRRYKPPTKADQSDAWTVPDDRKVNPWDKNERNPTDSGTMGTIPGPTIECSVGDSVVVHFRNRDLRTGAAIEKRVHSMHTHGFVFKRFSDGAYPLSAPDPGQPTGAEAGAWALVPGFAGMFKIGDRVPPNGTFSYHWETIGWPSTAGVWLYHDHSICDMDNVNLGAIGLVVIHNPADAENEVDIRLATDPLSPDPAFLPGGSANGSVTQIPCRPFPGTNPRVLPAQLSGIGAFSAETAEILGIHFHGGKPILGHNLHLDTDLPHELERIVERDGVLFHLNKDLTAFAGICLPTYRTPPAKAQYLLLFHNLTGVSGMIINGRTYLGNTPTVIGGTSTRMRFGIVGMGDHLHTFHLHGHRWVIPGPVGVTHAAIQGSTQKQSVSQFEDTRIFGPANSFSFTIDGASGSFMRAGGTAATDSLGEWHMHCHVLGHMMSGMMGSLMIIQGGELVRGSLPSGVPCHDMPTAPTPGVVNLMNSVFVPQNITIAMGSTVTFVNHDGFQHTVDWDTPGSPPNSGTIQGMGTPGDSYITPAMHTPGTFAYHCQFHGSPGSGMHGTVTVV